MHHESLPKIIGGLVFHLLKKVFVDLFEVQRLLIPAADIVPDHQSRELRAVDKDDT